MTTVSQFFSALVASGNGHRCNEFRSVLRDSLLSIEPKTGHSKVYLFKYCKNEYPKIVSKICRDIAKNSNYIYEKIDPYYFENIDVVKSIKN